MKLLLFLSVFFSLPVFAEIKVPLRIIIVEGAEDPIGEFARAADLLKGVNVDIVFKSVQYIPDNFSTSNTFERWEQMFHYVTHMPGWSPKTFTHIVDSLPFQGGVIGMADGVCTQGHHRASVSVYADDRYPRGFNAAVIAHEIGHQLGMTHSRSDPTAIDYPVLSVAADHWTRTVTAQIRGCARKSKIHKRQFRY